MKVNLHPSLKVDALKPGQELILNEGLNVIEAAGYEIQGEVVILKAFASTNGSGSTSPSRTIRSSPQG